MALEDGAVLGELFARIINASQIPDVLEMYEELREEQEERDRLFATGGLDEYSFPVVTPRFRDWLMGYDAFAEVEKAWVSEKRE